MTKKLKEVPKVPKLTALMIHCPVSNKEQRVEIMDFFANVSESEDGNYGSISISVSFRCPCCKTYSDMELNSW